MGIFQSRMDNCDEDNVCRVADVVVDDELEVGDIDKGQISSMEIFFSNILLFYVWTKYKEYEYRYNSYSIIDIILYNKIIIL